MSNRQTDDRRILPGVADEQIRRELVRRYRADDDVGPELRRARLRKLFANVDRETASALHERLRQRHERDSLSSLFHGRLSAPTRTVLLETLRREMVKGRGTENPIGGGPRTNGPRDRLNRVGVLVPGAGTDQQVLREGYLIRLSYFFLHTNKNEIYDHIVTAIHMPNAQLAAGDMKDLLSRNPLAYERVSSALRRYLSKRESSRPQSFLDGVAKTSGYGSARLKADIVWALTERSASASSHGPSAIDARDSARATIPLLISDPKGILEEFQLRNRSTTALFAQLLKNDDTRIEVEHAIVQLAKDAGQLSHSHPSAASDSFYLIGQQLGHVENATRILAARENLQTKKGSFIFSQLSLGLGSAANIFNFGLDYLESKVESHTDEKMAKLNARISTEAREAFKHELDPSNSKERTLLAYDAGIRSGSLSVVVGPAPHQIDEDVFLLPAQHAHSAAGDLVHAGLEGALDKKIEEEVTSTANLVQGSAEGRAQLHPFGRRDNANRGIEEEAVTRSVDSTLEESSVVSGAPRLAPPATESIDQILLSLRTEATRITRMVAEQDLQLGQTISPQEFGDINHSIFRSLAKQAIEDRRLPPTMKFAPAPIRITGGRLTRGRIIDAWDSATGVGWDLTTATVKSIAGHESYFGAVMPDGTAIRDVRPLVYRR